MLVPSKLFLVSLLIAIGVWPVMANQMPEPVGLTGLLPEVAFSSLSQRDPNPLGEKALALHPEQWKHGETAHFIYHFFDGYVVTPISVEAEFHYRGVAMELVRDQPPGDTKAHIYIFQQPADWQQFQTAGRLEKWTGGIHSQGSLFILRDPAYKFSNNTLGHEIAHLVLHRFYADGIPCWLNEGFAQYVSKGAQASYRRARGYDARPRSPAIARQDVIPLATLVAMTQPPSDHTETFYNQSERLVRFLASTDKANFLLLLDALARHQPFESALLRTYPGKFATVSAFEEQFRDYATKDSGTSLPDAGGG
jgi:hypothetical protein